MYKYAGSYTNAGFAKTSLNIHMTKAQSIKCYCSVERKMKEAEESKRLL